jgi:hypothetical protein
MARSEAQSAPSYRGLLALVIILGILIVLGVIGLIVAAAMGAGNRKPAATPYAAGVEALGGRVESAQLDGNRILIRLVNANFTEELVIVDAGTGRVIGRIAVSKP